MTFTGMEINALKKVAQGVTHSLLTGPGAGAGTVDKPLRTSRIPGIERRKASIEADDAMLFARELLKRAAKSASPDARPTDAEIEALAQAVGAAMFRLPNARVDLQSALEDDLDPVRIADRLRAGLPDVAPLIGEGAEPPGLPGRQGAQALRSPRHPGGLRAAGAQEVPPHAGVRSGPLRRRPT